MENQAFDWSTVIYPIALALVPVIIQLLRLLQAWINHFEWAKKSQIDDIALDTMIDVVEHVTAQTAAKAKQISPTGKISKEQAEVLRKNAIDAFMAYGKEKGVDFAKVYGPKVLDLLVEKALGIIKK